MGGEPVGSGLIHLPGVEAQQAERASVPSTMTAEKLEELIGPWLPRLQLYTSNAGAVKEHLIEAGHWGLPITPTTIIDLGECVDVVLAAVRDKALITMGDEFKSSTDKNSALFQRIREIALSGDNTDGAMFGPEFLTWIGTQQLYATIFLGTISARREAYAFTQALDRPSTLSCRLVGPNPRRRWEVPVITINDVFPFALPSDTTSKKAWEKFTKPDADGSEAVPTEVGARER